MIGSSRSLARTTASVLAIERGRPPVLIAGRGENAVVLAREPAVLRSPRCVPCPAPCPACEYQLSVGS